MRQLDFNMPRIDFQYEKNFEIGSIESVNVFHRASL